MFNKKEKEKMIPYDVKCVVFKIYAAGFVDGINSKNDSVANLRDSFNKYIEKTESIEKENNNDQRKF